MRTDGYLYEFTITSDFGPFAALGRSELDRRIDEIRAIAALHEVSKTEVFLEAAGGAIVDIGQSAASVVTNPEGTAKGFGAGIRRSASISGAQQTHGDLDRGRRQNRIVGRERGQQRARRLDSDAALGAEGRGRSVTTNPVLRDALLAIARVDAWFDRHEGGGARPACGQHRVVGRRSGVVERPGGVTQAERGAGEGTRVPEKVSAAFFRTGWYTLTLQTRLIAALEP